MILRVAPTQPEHASLLYPFLLEPSLYTFIPGGPPASVAALEAQFTRWARGCPDGSEQWCNWVSFEGEQPVGTLQATIRKDQSALLGYVVFRPFWGRGLASAGCRWLLEELFARRHVTRAYAFVDARNTASIRVAERAGLRLLAAHEAPADCPASDVVLMASAGR